MTPILRQICGCEIFIISKVVSFDLDISSKNNVTYLQQKYVGRNTHNSAFGTTSAAYYKEKVFPYGECLHANTKYFCSVHILFSY